MDPILVGLLSFGISGAYLKYYGEQNEVITKDNDGLTGESINYESSNNDYVEDNVSAKVYHPRENNPFDGLPMNDNDSNDSLISGFNKVFEKKVETLKDNIKPNPTNVDNISQQSVISEPSLPTNSENGPSSSPDQINQSGENASPLSTNADQIDKPNMISENEPSSLPTNVEQIDQTTVSLDSNRVNEIGNSPSYDLLAPHYLTAGIFSIFVYYLMYKFLRKTKPTQYQLWMKYFMSKINNPKPRLSRRVLDAYQYGIEKEHKILEIKEKLPVIFQNVEILDQFWDNQIINIKSHIEILSSVDESEKIRIPQQIAMPIKEDWDKQYTESKANHARMKELVTRNSLLTID